LVSKKLLKSKAEAILYPEADFIDAELSLFYAEYSKTDHLLIHDDKLPRRRFAYIYYLVSSEWTNSDGGHLSLFDSELKLSKKILPKRNSLIVFEVCKNSYHQVEEVTGDKTRKSLTGWFMGDTNWMDEIVPTKKSKIECHWHGIAKTDLEVDMQSISEIFNPIYLDLNTQGQIQEQFLDDSEICLTDFLDADFYKKIEKELINTKWKKVGPLTSKNYYKSVENGEQIKKLMSVLNSQGFALLLSNWTGLSLHESSEDWKSRQKPQIRTEVAKFTSGNYTLLSDQNESKSRSALELFLNFGLDDDYDLEIHGGQTTYLVENEDEELLTVAHQNNTLNLVFRDEGCLRFKKYLNSNYRGNMYEIKCVYCEDL